MATAARREELAPLRLKVAEAIEQVGWRQARPVVEEVLGVHASGPHGGWWSKVGKRAAPKLLQMLAERQRTAPVGQLDLFTQLPATAGHTKEAKR